LLPCSARLVTVVLLVAYRCARNRARMAERVLARIVALVQLGGLDHSARLRRAPLHAFTGRVHLQTSARAPLGGPGRLPAVPSRSAPCLAFMATATAQIFVNVIRSGQARPARRHYATRRAVPMDNACQVICANVRLVGKGPRAPRPSVPIATMVTVSVRMCAHAQAGGPVFRARRPHRIQHRPGPARQLLTLLLLGRQSRELPCS
jgi:hypothetical protein